MSVGDDLVKAFTASADADGRIAGGCDQCDAYQTLDASMAPLLRLTVHHDDWCPMVRPNRAERRRKK